MAVLHSRDKGLTGPERVDRISLQSLSAFLLLLWRTHKGLALAMVTLRFLRALTPVGQLWVARLILDQIVAVLGHTAGTDRLWILIACELALTVAGDGLTRASLLVESLLTDRFSIHASIRLMTTISGFSLPQVERVDYNDRLQRALDQTSGDRLELVAHLLDAMQHLCGLCLYGFAVVAYRFDLGIILLLSAVPSFVTETRYGILQYSMLFRQTPQRRELGYLRLLVTQRRFAKEVRVFGITSWLIGRYAALAQKFQTENSNLARRRTIASTAVGLLGTCGYYAAYVVVIRAAIEGRISIGQLTFLAGAFLRSRDLVHALVVIASRVNQHSLHVRDLFALLDAKGESAEDAASGHRRTVPRAIKTGFEFQDVGFRYADAETWALRHVNLHLRPGESVALVGENGAGKTTFTRLLGGLYEPTEGRILLDGIDLREYTRDSLRATICVLFQDYARYAMRFDENVGIGRIEAASALFDSDVAWCRREEGALIATPDAIRHAVEQSPACDVLQRLPNRYSQMLGSMFDHSVELSGGEWQKVALGRTQLRASGAQLIILDEPTAALDPKAERDVFSQFSRLMKGRMTVVVSHRFSTTRLAGRIALLHRGAIVESGTHEQLMARKGAYAELFMLQASAYRDVGDTPAVSPALIDEEISH